MASVQNIPGMRDFFGKKLGGWVASAFSHLSPIELHAGEAATKIATAAEGGPIAAGAEILGIIKGAIKDRGSYRVGDWFQGYNIGESREGLAQAVRQKRIAMRVGVPAMMGVSGVSGMVAPGNPLDTMSRTTLQMGALATTAGALGRAHWGLGAAYAAWGGLNMMRPGDNVGPF